MFMNCRMQKNNYSYIIILMFVLLIESCCSIKCYNPKIMGLIEPMTRIIYEDKNIEVDYCFDYSINQLKIYVYNTYLVKEQFQSIIKYEQKCECGSSERIFNFLKPEGHWFDKSKKEFFIKQPFQNIELQINTDVDFITIFNNKTITDSNGFALIDIFSNSGELYIVGHPPGTLNSDYEYGFIEIKINDYSKKIPIYFIPKSQATQTLSESYSKTENNSVPVTICTNEPISITKAHIQDDQLFEVISSYSNKKKELSLKVFRVEKYKIFEKKYYNCYKFSKDNISSNNCSIKKDNNEKVDNTFTINIDKSLASETYTKTINDWYIKDNSYEIKKPCADCNIVLSNSDNKINFQIQTIKTDTQGYAQIELYPKPKIENEYLEINTGQEFNNSIEIKSKIDVFWKCENFRNFIPFYILKKRYAPFYEVVP